METEVTVQLRLVSGHDLPKVDVFGHIDPFVKIFFNDQELKTTPIIQNNPEPVWEEDVVFDTTQDEDGVIQGIVRLDLYDKDLRSSTLVGTVEIVLGELQPSEKVQQWEYPVEFGSGKSGQKLRKQNRDSRLLIALVGVMKSFNTYVEELSETVEGLLVDEEQNQFYVPVPDTDNTLYTGIHYLPDAVYFKLVSTRKEQTSQHLDFRVAGLRNNLKVERRVYPKRTRLMQNLRIYQEASITNLPLSMPLSNIELLVFGKKVLVSKNVATVLEVSDFKGAGASFQTAAKEMAKTCTVDTREKCIYINVDHYQPPSYLLRLDYSLDTKTPALQLCTTKSTDNQNLYYDFFSNSDTTVMQSEAFRKSLKVQHNSTSLTRTLELEGAFAEAETVNSHSLVTYEFEKEPLSWIMSEVFSPPEPEFVEPDILPANPIDLLEPGAFAGVTVRAVTKAGSTVANGAGQLAKAISEQLSLNEAGVKLAAAGSKIKGLFTGGKAPRSIPERAASGQSTGSRSKPERAASVQSAGSSSIL